MFPYFSCHIIAPCFQAGSSFQAGTGLLLASSILPVGYWRGRGHLQLVTTLIHSMGSQSVHLPELSCFVEGRKAKELSLYEVKKRLSEATTETKWNTLLGEEMLFRGSRRGWGGQRENLWHPTSGRSGGVTVLSFPSPGAWSRSSWICTRWTCTASRRTCRGVTATTGTSRLPIWRSCGTSCAGGWGEEVCGHGRGWQTRGPGNPAGRQPLLLSPCPPVYARPHWQ